MSQILIEYQVCKTNDKFGISITPNNHEWYFNFICDGVENIYVNPKAPPESKWQRQHFFMVQLCQKIDFF